MLHNTFLGIGNSVISLQLLHREVLPFLVVSQGVLYAKYSSFHILFSRRCRWDNETLSMNFLNASGGMLSIPPAFPFLRCLIAVMTSASMSPTSIFGVGPASEFGGSVGRGRFNTSWKCSFHLPSWSSNLVGESHYSCLLRECFCLKLMFFNSHI